MACFGVLERNEKNLCSRAQHFEHVGGQHSVLVVLGVSLNGCDEQSAVGSLGRSGGVLPRDVAVDHCAVEKAEAQGLVGDQGAVDAVIVEAAGKVSLVEKPQRLDDRRERAEG